MTVAAEKAVCAWVNQTSGLTGTSGAPGPLAQDTFTIEERSPVGAGAYALVIRQQGPVQRMVAETSDLDCATNRAARSGTTEVAGATDRPTWMARTRKRLSHTSDGSRDSLAEDSFHLNRTCPLCPIGRLLVSDLDRLFCHP